MPIKKGTPKLLPLKRQLRSNQTRAEQLLWAKLHSKQFHELKFRRQHGIGTYIVDFFCPERSLVIEVDGDVHATAKQITRDTEREDYLRSLNIQVIRYNNDDVFNNLNGILEDLTRRLFKDSTSRMFPLRKHSPSLQRRGKLEENSNPLPREFFERPTLKVAKDLLGKVLMTQTSNNIIKTKIVDVEAYVGPKDKACHASKGRTKRTEVMFGPAGFTYVYIIYGMYHCLNLVTEEIDYPAAILIRGLEVINDNSQHTTARTCIDGPGRVCRFLNLDRTHNVLDATKGEIIWLEDRGIKIPRKQIQALPRIGVDYAGEWAKKLWRFCLPAPLSPKTHRIKPK